MMSGEENCGLCDVHLVAEGSVGYLFTQSALDFSSFTLSPPGDAVRRTGRDTSGATGHCLSYWMVLEMFLVKGELQWSSCHSF